jgi:hypothetical protein
LGHRPEDVAMLANGLGLGMFAAAMFCRPAWHFRGAGREVHARLASSPAVLFLYVGSLTCLASAAGLPAHVVLRFRSGRTVFVQVCVVRKANGYLPNVSAVANQAIQLP